MTQYLRALVRLDAGDPSLYPMTVPPVTSLERLTFDKPVTFLAGDNGCGKTTLLEILAHKLGAARADADALSTKRAFIEAAERSFRVETVKKPRQCFFFHAEGFVRYIDGIVRMRRESQEELARVEKRYGSGMSTAKAFALMPHENQLYQMQSMYKDDITGRSHGESFLDFFAGRVHDDGLYLVDEPESALTGYNQFVLMNLIADSVRSGCQWIISTHSPVLLAYPDAAIFDLTGGVIRSTDYRSLESVRFLRGFLAAPERYTRHLGEDVQEDT